MQWKKAVKFCERTLLDGRLKPYAEASGRMTKGIEKQTTKIKKFTWQNIFSHRRRVFHSCMRFWRRRRRWCARHCRGCLCGMTFLLLGLRLRDIIADQTYFLASTPFGPQKALSVSNSYSKRPSNCCYCRWSYRLRRTYSWTAWQLACASCWGRCAFVCAPHWNIYCSTLYDNGTVETLRPRLFSAAW